MTRKALSRIYLYPLALIWLMLHGSNLAAYPNYVTYSFFYTINQINGDIGNEPIRSGDPVTATYIVDLNTAPDKNESYQNSTFYPGAVVMGNIKIGTLHWTLGIGDLSFHNYVRVWNDETISPSVRSFDGIWISAQLTGPKLNNFSPIAFGTVLFSYQQFFNDALTALSLPLALNLNSFDTHAGGGFSFSSDLNGTSGFHIDMLVDSIAISVFNSVEEPPLHSLLIFVFFILLTLHQCKKKKAIFR